MAQGMQITEISIRRPAFITMIFVALAVLGIYGYMYMGVDFLPRMDFPYVSIVTVYPGAGPQEIETMVTKPLEEAVSSVEKLDNVRSYSYEGYSLVLAQFKFSATVDEVTNEVQRRVETVRSKLPKDALAPRISKSDMNAFPILRVSLTGSYPPQELYQLTVERLKPALEQVEGVSAVSIIGGLQREIRVEVDNQKLQSYGLSILQVSAAMERENLNFPTGKITEPVNQYTVRLAGKFRNLDEIRSMVVWSTPAGTIYLKDIAEIKDTYKEDYTISRLNEQRSIALIIQKNSDANAVKTADRLMEQMKKLEQQYKGTVAFTVAQDITEFTRASLSDVRRDLFLSILMVAAVLFLFLHSFRNSLIVLLSIPTSLISTFFFMYLFGYTLNVVSLMALALVIGILVDDSIVVLENIHRHQELGEEPVAAAIKGRSEIGFAAIAITLVDVVVFLPISLVGGMVGRIFGEFGLTIVVSTLLSLFVSFTLTPMLASKWMRITAHVENSFMGKMIRSLESWQDRLSERYRKVIRWALDHRKTIVFISGLLTLLSIAFLPLGMVGFEFFTESDRGEFAVNLDLPLGTSREKTDEAIKQAERIIAGMPEVTSTLSSVGKQQTQWDNLEQANVGQVHVKLVDKMKRSKGTKEVMREMKPLLSVIPGLKTNFSTISLWGMANSYPIIVEISGGDLTGVIQFAEKVLSVMKKTEGTADVTSSWQEGKPEVQIRVDREKAAALGLTLAEIGLAVRTALEGEIATKYQEGDSEYDTRIVLDKKSRQNANDVGNIILLNHYGQSVRLNQVAHIFFGKGPTEIQRKSRQRLVSIAANLSGTQPLGQVSAAIEEAINKEGIPPGISVFHGGDAENMRDMFSDMTIALSLAVLFVYMIMVSLFESYLHPFTIMFSLPVALVGALTSLVVTGLTLNMLSMIGIIMLMGLVTKNAILLVDYTNTLRSRGMTMHDALTEAGAIRLRPIVMTTATMMFGMMPLALGLGAGSEIRQGMAVIVIAGLLSSTLLTLVLVPVMYTYVETGREKVTGIARKKILKISK